MRSWRLVGRGVIDSADAAAFSRTEAESSAAATAASRLDVDMKRDRISSWVRRSGANALSLTVGALMLGYARTETMEIPRQAEPRCRPIARVIIIVDMDIPGGPIEMLMKIHSPSFFIEFRFVGTSCVKANAKAKLRTKSLSFLCLWYTR